MPTSSPSINCTKDGERAKHYQNYIFVSTQKDQELCVVSAFNEYLKHTETCRTNGDKFQLLLSYIKPHAEVHSSTVSRWIK